ncbi:hypothetical protein SNE510_73270 [Streptomyces sp. NE5-10]|nr:hypothetical protein SNE510_73270 [Streptomyces sp. NE5-10]
MAIPAGTEVAALALTRHGFHGDWTYVLHPAPAAAAPRRAERRGAGVDAGMHPGHEVNTPDRTPASPDGHGKPEHHDERDGRLPAPHPASVREGPSARAPGAGDAGVRR